MSNYKIILLDLGGVVFQSTGISNEAIDWQIITKLNKKYRTELDLGEGSLTDFLADYNNLTHQSLTSELFLKNLFDTLTINTALISMLQRRSNIIIVSDNYRESIAYISKRYHFDKWAIKQIYSFEYKLYKSNPAFFKRLLKDLKEYKTEELLFIDDSTSKLESAAKNGIKGILYQNNEQIKKVLEQYDSGAF